MFGIVKSYTTINKGKVVLAGTKDGQYFFKDVKRSKHLFKKASAWSINWGVFQQAELDGCVEVVIKDKESDLIYHTTFETFKKYGFKHNFNGYGEQIFLAESYFNVTNPKQAELSMEGWG